MLKICSVVGRNIIDAIYNASNTKILRRLARKAYTAATATPTNDEIISETCLTYENMGQLFTELLRYYGGRFDGEAMELLEKMMGEYILDTM